MSIKEFPSNVDYTNIVKNLKVFILDKSIKDGKPQYSKTKRLISYAGGYSKVFPVQIQNRKVALRFWTANVEDSQKRYQEIESYLKEKTLPYFVDFSYHHDSLNWKSSRYSFISMDWVEGKTLNRYLDKNVKDSRKIENLANKFLDMVIDLHKNSIAHGDLQDGNILVIERGSNIELKLIDYDSVYVPSLKDFTIEIVGVESYQHPNKSDTKKLNGKIDYFSELVIYLSLLAYSEDGSLWKQGQDQKLLFDSKDFKNSSKSQIFNRLKGGNFSSKIVELTKKLESYCKRESINELLPLEEGIKDRFKEVAKIFGDIKSGSRAKSTSKKIDSNRWNRDIDKVKKIFSATNSEVNMVDSSKVDNSFRDIIKKIRG